MKFVSFENKNTKNQWMMRVENLIRLEVKNHDNPENNNLMIFIRTSDDMNFCYEVEGFDYGSFVSFLNKLEEGQTEIFKIDVNK